MNVVFVAIRVTRYTLINYREKPVPHFHTAAEDRPFLFPVGFIDESQRIINVTNISTRYIKLASERKEKIAQHAPSGTLVTVVVIVVAHPPPFLLRRGLVFGIGERQIQRVSPTATLLSWLLRWG